ncbi:MAG: J domain-containing protein [Pseudomonadota bacterium]
MTRPPRDADTFLRGDWFAPAILSAGSVESCLLEVEELQQHRARFIKLLRERLVDPEQRNSDALTSLGSRLKTLEQSVRSLPRTLAPERYQTWFRAPLSQEVGPFSSKIEPMAVIGYYASDLVLEVKGAVQESWRNRNTENLPFSITPKNLWGELLTINSSLKHILELPQPFENGDFFKFAETLPRELASESLAAFLRNVAHEAKLLIGRLDQIYILLYGITEKLWAYQENELNEAKARATSQDSSTQDYSNDDVKQMRDGFKRRRQEAKSNFVFEGLTRKDLDSLKCMGFSDIPDSHSLRSRYIELAKKYHPDRGGDESVFKDLTLAYSYLNHRIERLIQNN